MRATCREVETPPRRGLPHRSASCRPRGHRGRNRRRSRPTRLQEPSLPPRSMLTFGQDRGCDPEELAARMADDEAAEVRHLGLVDTLAVVLAQVLERVGEVDRQRGAVVTHEKERSLESGLLL